MINNVNYSVGRKKERRNIATHRPNKLTDEQLKNVVPVSEVVGNELSVSPLDYQSLSQPISPNIDTRERDPLSIGF